MISLEQLLISLYHAFAVFRAWLETPFAEGRHRRQIRMIDAPVDVLAQAKVNAVPGAQS
jgi:ribose 5-phosphate isomerase RpiB